MGTCGVIWESARHVKGLGVVPMRHTCNLDAPHTTGHACNCGARRPRSADTVNPCTLYPPEKGAEGWGLR
jgi:hypothetical protein